MKTNCRLVSRLAAFGAAALLAATASAQPTNNPNNFDDATSTTSFVTWWTGPDPDPIPNPTMVWDGTQDAAGNPSSGSVRYTVLFTGRAGEQFSTWFSFANRWGWDAGTVLDGTLYTNVAFDIKVDPASAITPGGNYGWLEVSLVTHTNDNSFERATEKGMNIPLSATNWTHVNMPIDVTSPGLDKVVGFCFRMWSNGAHTNSLIFNLDNVAMQKPEVFVPLTPPTMRLAKALPGLTFVAASGGQWDRQNIRTIGSNFSWMGRPGPVSYTVDIAKHAPVDGFQLHMYLVPGLSNPNRPDSDWHETNCLTVAINGNPSGGCWTTVRCKVNAPENNGRQYEDVATGGGGLGGFWANNGVGPWTLTIDQDTNLVVTAPDGAALTNTIPASIMDVWKTIPGMQFAVGIMPGDPARIGYMATVKGVKITGTADTLDSSFVATPRDTNVWNIVAASPAYGVQENPTDKSVWLTWTLPANNFRLQSSTTLESGSWTNSPLAGFAAGGKQTILVPPSAQPGPNAGYFRLMRDSIAYRLIVVLPGETFAPGTETGKTGTPINQPTLTDFNVTVYMVDRDNYPVRTSTDTIRFTATTAPGQTLVLPPDTALVNGTSTAAVSSWDAGTATITAEDLTNPTIQAGSSTVTFQ